MRSPRLQHIKMFDAAARHQNFRLAAEELNLTQGAVAQAVRTLEADLNVVLFERKARGLAFTEAGQLFHSEISKGLAIIEEATKKLYPIINSVTISVPPSFASKWLVPRLPLFMETHPDIDVRIFASEQITDFKSQNVDLAVRQGNRPSNQKLEVRKLAPLELKAFCSPSAEFCPQGHRQLTDLVRLPLIQDGHRHWDRLLGDHGLSHSGPSLQFNQTSLALDAAANRQGIAVAPRLVAEADVRSGRLCEVWSDDTETDLGFWLVHPVKRPANLKARSALVDWISSECR
ncbi:LysR substrate-binding domain-containing protein [Roseibium sp. HPY-6]|uniref:LysR substrate-binding domain-containing protein n=1 Tax=Roseibium sp. HPY-6 TaxID=3229852 RepID=UPI00338E689F